MPGELNYANTRPRATGPRRGNAPVDSPHTRLGVALVAVAFVHTCPAPTPVKRKRTDSGRPRLGNRMRMSMHLTPTTPDNRERRERVSAPSAQTPVNRKQTDSGRLHLCNRMRMSMHLTPTAPDNRERRERASATMLDRSGHALRPARTPSGHDTCFFTKQRFHTTQTIDSNDEQSA